MNHFSCTIASIKTNTFHLKQSCLRLPIKAPQVHFQGSSPAHLPANFIPQNRNRLLIEYHKGNLLWQDILTQAFQIDREVRGPIVKELLENISPNTIQNTGTPPHLSRGVFSDYDILILDPKKLKVLLGRIKQKKLLLEETPFYYKLPQLDIFLWKTPKQVKQLTFDHACKDREVMYIGTMSDIPLESLLGHLNKVIHLIGYFEEKQFRLLNLHPKPKSKSLGPPKTEFFTVYERWIQVCKAATKVIETAGLDTTTDRYKALKAFSKMQIEPQAIGLIINGPNTLESRNALREEVKEIFAQAFQKTTRDLAERAEALLANPTPTPAEIRQFHTSLHRINAFYTQLKTTRPKLLSELAPETEKVLAYYHNKFVMRGRPKARKSTNRSSLNYPPA